MSTRHSQQRKQKIEKIDGHAGSDKPDGPGDGKDSTNPPKPW